MMKKFMLVLLAFGLFTFSLFAQNCIDRKTAVDLLLQDASGVPIDVTASTVWSPFVDYGFGAGFEGLLPEGTIVEPKHLGVEPFPGESIVLNAPAYFFWVDDDPSSSLFVHETRFVLLYPNCESKGGVATFYVSDQGWWPLIKSIDGDEKEYFETDIIRESLFPGGYNNPDGLIAGFGGVVDPVESLKLNGSFKAEASAADPNAYGLVVQGAPGAAFDADTKRFCDDLENVQGVPKANIVKSNGGGVSSLQDLCDAITKLCELGDGNCTKIYVRMSSHGGKGEYELGGKMVKAAKLCEKFKKLAGKGAPICYLFNGCHTGSLIDDKLWCAPPGSSVITAADGDNKSYGWKKYCLIDGTDTVKVTGSCFPIAISRCQKDKAADTNKDGKVTDCEAYDWMKKRKPCFYAPDLGVRRYPAGPPPGKTGKDPKPQKKSIKTLVLETSDGIKYHAPGNQTVKLPAGKCFTLSVPESATDIMWKLNGEPIPETNGKSKIEGKAPEAGTTNVYMVTYIYNKIEYSYMIEVIGTSDKEPYYVPVLDWQQHLGPNPIVKFEVQRVYPNPFQTTFNLELLIDERQRIQLRLIDQSGRINFQQIYQTEAGINTVEVAPTGQLTTGQYWIQLINEQGEQITKSVTLK